MAVVAMKTLLVLAAAVGSHSAPSTARCTVYYSSAVAAFERSSHRPATHPAQHWLPSATALTKTVQQKGRKFNKELKTKTRCTITIDYTHTHHHLEAN